MQRFKLKLANLGAIKFLLIILIVCIHASPSIVENYTNSTVVQIYLSQIFSRISVPLYFFISGYLMAIAMKDFNDWNDKLKRRFKTVLVPYLIWNGLYGFLLIVISYSTDYNTSVNGDMSLLETLNHIFINPAISPLWFLRDLLLFQILSVFLILLPRLARYVLIIALCLFWLKSFHFFETVVSTEGALFFTLGLFAWLPFYNFFASHSKWLLFGLAFLFSILDLKIRYSDYWWSLSFHRITVALICYSFVFIVNETDRLNFLLKRIKKLSTYSFYIFVLHFPLLFFIDQFLTSNNLIEYFIKIILAILLSISLGFVINQFPKLSKVLTGNRITK